MSELPTNNPQLDHARYYARLGWSVVPTHKAVRLPNGETACTCEMGTACVSKGKHPAVAWSKYQAQRANDEQITNWFTRQYRGYGVGIITGRVSGIFVVDVDEAPGKEGAESLQNAQMVNGDLPETVQARTGGGGRHLIFKHPGGDTFITTGKNIFGPGVDVRGDGGFIVAAPSIHESGAFYFWDDHSHPNTTPIAEAPEWVIDGARGDAPASGTRNPSTGTGEIIRDQWGKVIDGRERHMVGIICGAIASAIRVTGGLPDAETVFADAWPAYERTTRARGLSLEADHRGESLMRQRIQHMLRRAASGKWKVEVPPPLPPEKPVLTETIDPETGEIMEAFPATPFDPGEFDSLQPRRWVYGHFLIRRYLSVLGAPGGTGKTAYAMTVGVAVALDRPLLKEAVHEAGAVWIYNLEDPRDEVLRRLQAICLQNGIAPSELKGRLFLDSGRDRKLVLAEKSPDGTVVATPVVQPLVEELKSRGIKLLIVDPFVKSHKLEENRNEQVDFAATLWNSVAEQADCAILLAHHFRKGGVSGEADAFRGASALIDAARAAVSLSVMSEQEAKNVGIDLDERRFHIRADNAKLNLAPPPKDAVWLRLNNVELPNGDRVGAVVRWEPPSPWEGLAWDIIERVFARIEEGPSKGEYWSLSRQAKGRWAGHILLEEAGKSEAQAASILKAWKEHGALEEGQYSSPAQKGGITGCVRANLVRVSEMRRDNARGSKDAN